MSSSSSYTPTHARGHQSTKILKSREKEKGNERGSYKEEEEEEERRSVPH